MKNGTLRFIPLQAELCLNKQKVDIEDFKGWQKCNAPVYGGCLSPLYKKEDTHHDIFIGNDTYDFTSGTLYKNGTAVLSGAGSKKIKKTRISQDYSALAVSDADVLTWLKETSATTVKYSINGGTEIDTTLSNCQRVVCTKAFANDDKNLYGIVVMFLRTDGNYGYYMSFDDNGTMYSSYGSQQPTFWTGFNVVSPLIQVGCFAEHKFMVSFFGTSGANLAGTDVKNVYVENGVVYDAPIFYDTSLYPARYETKEQTIYGITIDVDTKLYFHTQSVNTYESFGYGVRQTLKITVPAHTNFPIWVRLTVFDPEKTVNIEQITFPATNKDTVYERRTTYWVSEGVTNYDVNCHIYQGSTDLLNITTSGTGFAPAITGDYSNVTEYKIYQAYDMKGEASGRMMYAIVGTPNLTNKNDVTTPAVYGQDIYGSTVGGMNTSSYRIGVTTGMNWDLSGDGSGIPPRLISGGSWYKVTDKNYAFRNGAIIYNGVCGYETVEPEFFFGSWEYPNKDNAFSYASLPFSANGLYKTQYSEQSLKNVDCCMDDGKLYCVGAMSTDENEPLPTKLFALAGAFSNYNVSENKLNYTSTATFNITYDLNDETNVFPKYFKGMNISIGNNYLRIVYLFKAKKDDTEYINIMVDSLAIAEGDSAAHLYAGIQSGTNANLQGGVKNTVAESGFRLLFNNNMVSNIACYEKKAYIGTILVDWFTIDESFCPAMNSDTIYYKDNNNRIWKMETVSSGEEWSYRFIENRYIVLNTVNYFNCYDTKTGLKRHWASDYNNRLLYGYSFSAYSNNETFRDLLTRELFSGLMITAQNANYEETKDTITGIELGAILYSRVLKDLITFISCDTPYGAVEGIDTYRGDNESTAALYICSYQNSMKYIDNDLVNPDAVYPISQNGDIRYNPNLFTRFITSYNNKDMVISDGIAYKLLYFNNVIPVMAYNLLDGVEELLDAFVLQTSYYGVSETRLYQMNYTNGVGVEVVADITGLEYLGALPSQALFWSAQNRAIYTFRGNCIMTLSQYANELTGIYGKWYNPATQELFLDTNIGILVFSDLGTYCLEWETETETKSVKDIFFFNDRFLINLENDTEYTYYYSYNPLEEYESNGIKILTKYYGNGLVPITVNNVYIRLYNQNIENAEGSIVFKGHTITDIGTHTDTKEVLIGGEDNPQANPPTVAGEAWDTETNTMLVKYTPQYNRGLGFSLEVDTTFPIIDIKFDYVENGSIESQIAHINI